MAVAWITQLMNFTRTPVTLIQSDPSWHPVVLAGARAKRYNAGEAITLPAGTGEDEPSLLTAAYFIVPWVNSGGDLKIHGPQGMVRIIVGPVSNASGDHLRVLDSHDKEIANVPLGSRGGGWRAPSWDFHLVVEPGEVRWVVWDVNDVGQVFAKVTEELLKLVPKVIGKAVGV